MLKRIFRSTLQRSLGKIEKSSKEPYVSKSLDEKIGIDEQEIIDKATIPSPLKKKIHLSTEPLGNTTTKKIEEEAQKHKKNHGIEIKLLEHCIIMEKLASSTNWEPTKTTLSILLSEWTNLDANNDYPELKERFNEAYLYFMKRYNNHIKIKQLILVREQICNEIESLTLKANSENAINRILAIESDWSKSSKIPIRYFEIINKRYNKLIAEFHKSTKILKAEEIAQEKIKEDIKAKEHTKNIAKLNLDKTKLTQNEEKELTLVLEELYSQLKQLINTDNPKSVLSSVDDIQFKWGKIKNGKIKTLYSEKFNKLFHNYFSDLRLGQQKEEWARWENYSNKLLLCEQAEMLLTNNDFFKVSKELKTIWEKWRNIGPVPKEKNESVWDRFNIARKELNGRCKVFFENLNQEKIKNAHIKVKLCEDAEKIKDSNEWESSANTLKIIQKMWKETGRAPQPQDDELYKRLRAACNYFFDQRGAFYNKLHERQETHKESKKKLCTQAEELVNLPWQDAFKKIKELRSQWNSTPSASRRDEQALWSTFNSSIEAFINKIETGRPINLKKKEELYQKAVALLSSFDISSNVDSLSNSIDEISTQWKQLGPGPKEKDSKLNSIIEPVFRKLDILLHNKKIEVNIEYRKILLKKESLISQIETIATLGEESFTQNIDQIKKIQNEWGTTNQHTSSKEEKLLEKRFTETYEAFYNKEDDFFNSIKGKLQENLKAKRKLCIQLEHLAGITASKDILHTQKSNTLADEIKFSIENNFATNNSISEREIISQYHNIQKKWKSIGPIPVEYYEYIYIRFDQACNSIELINKKGV